MKTTILSVVLLASGAIARPRPGLPFLLIWPTARSTALAGAMTGLADDPAATFFNPAGLAFQNGASATASYANWLPGLYPGLKYAYLGGAVRTSKRFCAGVDATWFFPGEDEYGWDDPGYLNGTLEAWRGALAGNAAVQLSDYFALGATAKIVHSQYVPDWAWIELPGLGIEIGGTGTTWAADIGVLWKPSTRFSLGGSVANLGPGIAYTSSGEHDPSPAILRLGACWTPISDQHVRVNVLPELDKVLVGIFFDTTDAKTFGQKLQAELGDAWKALAVEASGFEVLSIRLGYFEDRTWQRGGLVFENDDGVTCHYGVGDVLTGRHLGKLKGVGLCWGFGVGHKDYFRIDVSSDAAIYDFPTKNWKVTLVANDIADGIRELKQVRLPWEI